MAPYRDMKRFGITQGSIIDGHGVNKISFPSVGEFHSAGRSRMQVVDQVSSSTTPGEMVTGEKLITAEEDDQPASPGISDVAISRRRRSATIAFAWQQTLISSIWTASFSVGSSPVHLDAVSHQPYRRHMWAWGHLHHRADSPAWSPRRARQDRITRHGIMASVPGPARESPQAAAYPGGARAHAASSSNT